MTNTQAQLSCAFLFIRYTYRMIEQKVELYLCRAHFPFSFALHPWFVVYREDAPPTRYEVLLYRNRESDFGFVHRRSTHLTESLTILKLSPKRKIKSKPKLWHTYTGQEASRLTKVLELLPTSYPQRDRYIVTHNNSNSFAKWVLEQSMLPNILPWNCIG